MSSGFSTLCTNEICSGLASLVGMLWMTNHVHVQNAVLVKLLDNMLGRNADSGDEHFGLLGNDDIH